MPTSPLDALVLHTPRLCLRLASEPELDALAAAAVGRVLAPEQADLMESGWTQAPSPTFEREFVRFHRMARENCTPQAWSLQLIGFRGEEPIGCFALASHPPIRAENVDACRGLLGAARPAHPPVATGESRPRRRSPGR